MGIRRVPTELTHTKITRPTAYIFFKSVTLGKKIVKTNSSFYNDDVYWRILILKTLLSEQTKLKG